MMMLHRACWDQQQCGMSHSGQTVAADAVMKQLMVTMWLAGVDAGVGLCMHVVPI
jgi:hypothetical protein